MDNTYESIYEFWKQNEFFDTATRTELENLDPYQDREEIEERFYRDLDFGTGGLRGVMGAGTNRMNLYTVGKATTGLGRYLLDTYGYAACMERGVVVGYDTRNNSRAFARTTANVLSRLGILTYLHADARPTPQLSFSIRHFNALAGVVITASHNPREYNGYKVYDEFGCQLVPWQAAQVIAYINAIDYRTIDFNGNIDLIRKVDVTHEFVAAVMEQSLCYDRMANRALEIVYSPLHGTGHVPVIEALCLDGFSRLDEVLEQSAPDGAFPTVISPNPEDAQALRMAIARGKAKGADLVLGTDPDCDRVGVAVKTGDDYLLLTGNQIGALLMDYILSHKSISDIHKPAVVKTVVTSELGAEIAKEHGVAVFSTLTGFKYIGERITQFEQAKSCGDDSCAYTFIFGYEESYGYLIGTHARDKDAVVACLLICEMAAEYKAKNTTLIDRLNEIYAFHGYYKDAMDNFTLKGKDGLAQISSMMVALRKGASPFSGTVRTIDYSIPISAEPGFGMLPASNVIKYILDDGSWIAVRPSGTEPKVKIYYSIRSSDRLAAEKRLSTIQGIIQAKLGLKADAYQNA